MLIGSGKPAGLFDGYLFVATLMAASVAEIMFGVKAERQSLRIRRSTALG